MWKIVFDGGDCLKTQTSSVKIDTKLVKMALNIDLKDKKMTKKVAFVLASEDYFCEQNGIIELYNKSINLMLINFFVETFEGLKKNVGDKLKKEKMETTTLDRLVYAPADDDMLKVRLINNCIKHNDSKVSDDLSRKFPGEYTKNDEIDINPELVYELLEITVNAIRKFNKLFNQYYHD